MVGAWVTNYLNLESEKITCFSETLYQYMYDIMKMRVTVLDRSWVIIARLKLTTCLLCAISNVGCVWQIMSLDLKLFRGCVSESLATQGWVNFDPSLRFFFFSIFTDFFSNNTERGSVWPFFGSIFFCATRALDGFCQFP